MPDTTQQFVSPGNQLNNIMGADIASAATIAPTHLIHRVTGAVAIVNITVPYVGFAGFLCLIGAAGSAFTWTAAGNISLASTGAQTVASCALFVYDPITAKWTPVIDNA